MKYSIEEISEIIHAQVLNEQIYPYDINEVYYDTRKGNFSNDAMFLAIDGKNADGHQYIKYAYNQLQTRNFLISKAIDTNDFPNSNFLLCENVITALQKLAMHHRGLHHIDTIGITGSNGKTIVKEWIFQLIEDQLNIVRSPGSFNSQLGVPISILKIEPFHNLGIFEAGISNEGEMEILAEIIKPQFGIITNIGEAHSAGFQNINEKLADKLKLFHSCQRVLYCMDQNIIHQALKSSFPNIELISWSVLNQNADYYVQFHDHKNNSTIQVSGKKNAVFQIPFSDQISKENAVFAIITALEFGINTEILAQKTPNLQALKMRLEMKQGINNCFLINDSYSSDFLALSSALHILEQQQKKSKNTLILSQIEESNFSDEILLERIAGTIGNHAINKVIAVGIKLKNLKSYLDKNIEFQHFENTNNLLEMFSEFEVENENILIKGARSFNLEKVFQLLSTKVHQTVLEIDLEAMRHNLFVFRSFLEKGTKLMVVLKASGYGSGSTELSRFLAFQRVDYIAVAYIDEGIELRKSEIDIPIMVMNPEESGFAQMINYRLEPEIYSLTQLRQLLAYLPNGNYPIHLKIETGMNRLGIEMEEIEEITNLINESKKVSVASIFSHLVGSDNKIFDKFSMQQIETFEKAFDLISLRIGYSPIRHILNSNGISRFPEYQYEMVRLGIGLHGISDDASMNKRLQKVQTLKTRVSQIKNIAKDETVGYNRKFKALKTTKTATINIGYADGLPRNAGNLNYSVLINGYPAPIVGNVCMDMCMIDISDLNVKVGDEVIIFGAHWAIENLALACETIPYEILTRLSTRIHRIFSRE